jgi:hypothetical protein
MKQNGEFYIKVQCTVPETGDTATFLSQYENGKERSISPAFPSLAELYPWMKRNGYASDEYEKVDGREVFRPWRVKSTRPEAGRWVI